MGDSTNFAGLRLKHSPFRSIAALACVIATFFVGAMSANAVAHDHEDHHTELGDAQCFICALVCDAHDDADPSLEVSPFETWIAALRPQPTILFKQNSSSFRTARGPPFSRSS